MKIFLFCLTVLCGMLASAGCGYSMKSIYKTEYAVICIPVIENKTLRREHEFDLTDAVIKAYQERTRYAITAKPENADVVIRGEIENYLTPSLVENIDDQVIVSSVTIKLNIIIFDKNNSIIYNGSRVESANFSGTKGESEASAKAEVIEKLARWAVSCMENPW
ncbi:MAG: hypothetical protein HZA48_09600 [Planctomycetes bacterium]|nr:hypothetical protein [Planctomycetota bacterium]